MDTFEQPISYLGGGGWGGGGGVGISVIQKTLNTLQSRIMNVPSVKKVLRCFF